MGRIYTVTFDNLTVPATNAMDLFEISPASNKPCRVKAFKIDQFSDMGDAQEEGLRVTLLRVPATATSGSGGSAPTPRLVTPTGAAAGFSAETGNTTVATTSGTLETLFSGAINIRIGMELWLPPELQFEVVNATLAVLRIVVGPADAVSMNGTMWVEEEG